MREEPPYAPAATVAAPRPTPGGADAAPPNADLLLPYLLPYGAYVAIAALASDLGRVPDYAIRIVATAALLIYLRKRFQPIAGPRPVAGSVLVGAVAGLLGVLLWIALVLPFQDATAGEAFGAPAFALRVAAATLVVPLAEELLFRGYLLGLVTQWQQARRDGAADAVSVALDRRSVQRIEPGAWTALAVLVSSAAFALGHSTAQWAAAFAYGLLMAGLWILRRDLVAPITAHAVTNLALYLYVFRTGSWGLW
jgi:CAAX prenyl protease-like protein